MKGLVIATTKSAVLELVSGARKFCGEVALISVGKDAPALCADRAYMISPSGSRIECTGAIVGIVDREQPDMVLVESNTDGRYFSAYIAARLKTSVLTDSSEFFESDRKICSRRMTYGGIAYKTEMSNGKTVACVGSGVFEAAEETPTESVEKVDCTQSGGIVMVAKKDKEVRHVNLASAKKVVGVGRGIGEQANLRLAEELAASIGAELACTRPIAEEEKWMGKERYVGISGLMIKPELYIALGISGQIQHTAGVNSSGVIVCVNRDKNAPIFKQCDYGFVGDIKEVVPQLTELLS